jgi:hypothetical protein
VDHYYDLFLDMLKVAKNDLTLACGNKKSTKKFDALNLKDNFVKVDLKLPIEGLEEPFVPWKDNPWIILHAVEFTEPSDARAMQFYRTFGVPISESR